MALNHALVTHVGGRLQTIDETEIIARNRGLAEMGDTALREPATMPPSTGIMTRTIVQSPVIRWAFAARIRLTPGADVILVRENSVEIKEVLAGTNKFRDVALKTDFNATILSAATVQVIETHAGETASNPIDLIMDQGMNRRHFNQEPSPSLAAMTIDAERPFSLPQHLLALSLRSVHNDWLSFLYSVNDGRGVVRFVSFNYLLPPSGQPMMRFGKRLAVDPL